MLNGRGKHQAASSITNGSCRSQPLPPTILGEEGVVDYPLSGTKERVAALDIAEHKVKLQMFDDTVYAYEFALANMEVEGITGKPNFSPGLLEGAFEIEASMEVQRRLIARLAYFERVNKHFTHQKFLTEVTGAVTGNHAKAYMTHWMYPYKGKFHPQMIRAIFNIINARKGDVILDPMTGSGTVNVEAKLMGIDSIGFDCLPIAVLTSRVKTQSLESTVAKDILWSEVPVLKMPRKGLDAFGDSVDQTDVNLIDVDFIKNEKVRDFFRLLAFEVTSISRLPNKKFDEVWKKMLGHYIQTIKSSTETIEKLELSLGQSEIKLGDARKLDLDDESVNHIVTSPPYAIAIDYVVRNTEQLRQMGYSVDEIYDETIGLRGKGDARIDNYYKDLKKSIAEMHRVLKENGKCVIIIGDTQFDKKSLPTIARCIDFAEKSGFKLLKNVPKVSAGRFGLFRTERMLFFEKPSV